MKFPSEPPPTEISRNGARPKEAASEDARRYRERRLAANDRVYRGQDGRYYCRRNDGTTGLIVGAAVGGVLGNIIAPGGSKTLGTLLGAGAGAVAGTAIDKEASKDMRCR